MQTLFDSEFKVMEIVWAHEPITAKQISVIAGDTIGWNKNTTYKVLKKLVDKGILLRGEPDFVCSSAVSRQQVQKAEARSLIDRMFDGSKKALFSALLEDEPLTNDELDAIRRMIGEKRS